MPRTTVTVVLAVLTLVVVMVMLVLGTDFFGMAQAGAAGAATTTAATAAVASTPTYTALGDSYASGPDIPTQAPSPKDCARSSHNYPADLAAELDLHLTDATCSGATTTGVLGPESSLTGPTAPQIDSVKATDALVTLTIGGDDLGFSSIIAHCLAATPYGPVLGGILGHYIDCRDHYDATGFTTLASDIAGIKPKVAEVLAAIHRAAPHAVVALFGYPDILPPTGDGCWPTMPFTRTDAPYLDGIEQRLNAMLASAAAENASHLRRHLHRQPGRQRLHPSRRTLGHVLPAHRHIDRHAPQCPRRGGDGLGGRAGAPIPAGSRGRPHRPPQRHGGIRRADQAPGQVGDGGGHTLVSDACAYAGRCLSVPAK